MTLVERETFLAAVRSCVPDGSVLSAAFASPRAQASAIPIERIERVGALLQQGPLPMKLMRLSWAEFWFVAEGPILNVAAALLLVLDQMNEGAVSERWQGAVLPLQPG